MGRDYVPWHTYFYVQRKACRWAGIRFYLYHATGKPGSKAHTHTMPHTQTVQDAIAKDAQAFRALSRNYRTTLRKRAFAYLAERPGCGDYIGFWLGLSARHVTQIGEASR